MKPDLRKLYQEKEEARIQKMAELEECGNVIRKVLDQLNKAIIEHPEDLDKIAQVAKDCMEQLKFRLKIRDFQMINKFDIERLLRNRLEMIRPKSLQNKEMW